MQILTRRTIPKEKGVSVILVKRSITLPPRAASLSSTSPQTGRFIAVNLEPRDLLVPFKRHLNVAAARHENRYIIGVRGNPGSSPFK